MKQAHSQQRTPCFTTQSYHLGGMGCSNGVVAVNLVASLLRARPGANAVLLTTESVTPALYPGHDRHRMVRLPGGLVIVWLNSTFGVVTLFLLPTTSTSHFPQN
jgi:hypothetical protein